MDFSKLSKILISKLNKKFTNSQILFILKALREALNEFLPK